MCALESNFIIKNSPVLLEWRVVHLPYPRETQEQSYIGVKWFLWKGIKLPKFFIQKRTLEKPGAAVNHDLLCQQIESFLNSDEMKGYDLFSISSTYSGHPATTPTPKHPYQQLMMARSHNNASKTKEVLVIILKKKSAD